MSKANGYLLDANVFIQAKNQYYTFEICPGFWESLVLENKKNTISSIDRVKTEIDKGNDELKDWANDAALKALFKKADDKAVVDWFAKIMNFVQNEPQYTPGAKADFAACADP